jgi:hypothetical protein
MRQFQQAQPTTFNQPQPPPPATPTPQQNVQAPSSFTLAINAVNGDFSGVLIMNGQTSALDRDTVEQYALVSFNSVRDILWFKCPQGYIVSDSSSSTGNKITGGGDKDLINIEISSPQQVNNITATCTNTH